MNEKKQRPENKSKFIISIQKQQNTSFQGEITRLQSGREGETVFFRSLRELIVLLEEALQQEQISEVELRSWNGDKGYTSRDYAAQQKENFST